MGSCVINESSQIKIYCYTNKVNGKKYIGQTSGTLVSRAGKYGKKYASSTKFFNDILKYGWHSFEPTILETTTMELADDRERYWIKHFDAVKSGYNSSDGGKIHHTFSEETRNKIKARIQQYGARFKGKAYDEERKRNV